MGRKTIAFLGETSFDKFQGQMLLGAMKAARENGINLVRVSLESIENETRLLNQVDVGIDLIRKVKPDGLMFVGWTREIAINEQAFLENFKKKYRIPILSVGKKINNVPSVYMDGDRSILELLAHLVDVHGYRNIVFIQPVTPDERYAAYESFMRERGLFKPELVITNDILTPKFDWFFVQRVSYIAQILFDERKIDVDVIMSMYTYEAFFILEELKSRGISVPRQIALTSWEDGDMGQYATPSITSVYYPFYEQGYEGCNILCHIINGEDTSGNKLIPGRLVVRRSCGCFSKRMDGVERLRSASPKCKTVTPTPQSLRKAMNTQKIPLSRFDPREIIELINEDLFSGQSDSLLKHVEHTLSSHNGDINYINEIQNDLFALRTALMPFLAHTPEHQLAAENIWLGCQVLIQDSIETAIGFGEVMNRGNVHILKQIGHNIVTVLDMKRLLPILDESLKRIKIPRCVIILLPNEFMPNDEQFFYYYHNERKENPRHLIAPGDTSFMDQIHRNDPNWNIFLTHILHIDKTLIGYILFEPGPEDERIYHTLSVQLSSAILGALSLSRLEESNKKLSGLDKLKNDFIANVTHDFRSPLMVTLNSVDLGLKYDTDGDMKTVRRRYTTIMNASLKLKDTIDRLLDIAKMDARGMKLHIKNVKIREYIEDIIDFYKSAVVSSSIQIKGDLPPREIHDFYSDQDRLEEIINNIISNALKYVDPGHGEITISLVESDSAVRISIADNGIGIPADKLETIFGRFEQIDDAKMSHHKGTGIGLSFSRQLAEYLGGSIWAESDGPGKGSRFIIDLRKGVKPQSGSEDPLLTGALTDAASPGRSQTGHLVRAQLDMNESEKMPEFTALSPNADGEFDPLKGIIVIIDDNPHIREIIHEYLIRSGYHNLILATNGKNGMEAIYRNKPDLIICDYNMPVMTGKELQDNLQSNSEYRGIPLIFLTAIANREIMIDRKKKGAVAYLQKPIDQNEFIATVESNMRKQMELRRIVQQATLDTLTGISNKHSIIKFLKDRLMLRSYHPLSIIFIDIDLFKSINDVFGHRAGDTVLARVGSIIKDSLRVYDRAGRYGGDEFLIALPEASISEAAIVAEKIRSIIAAEEVICDGTTVRVTGSFGISSLIDNETTIARLAEVDNLTDIFDIEDSKTADWNKIEQIKSHCSDILIELADKALYESKRTQCGSCGFGSLKRDDFIDNICPSCRKSNIIPGRNMVTLFSDEIKSC